MTIGKLCQRTDYIETGNNKLHAAGPGIGIDQLQCIKYTIHFVHHA